MISFQKKDVEKLALEKLKEYEPEKFEDAFISDRPDIQNNIKNIGIEVVTQNFAEIQYWSTLWGIPLLTFLKRVKCPKVRKKKVSYLLSSDVEKETLDEFFQDNPYIELDKRAHRVNTIDDLINLDDSDWIYLSKNSSILFEINNAGITNWVQPPAFWVEKIPQMLWETYVNKANKVKSYKKFPEMNLYIQVLSADKEEFDKFRKLLTDNLVGKNPDFNRVYMTSFWGSNLSIYEIILVP